MPGWLTDGLAQTWRATGAEMVPYDTELTGGQAPQTVAMSLLMQAMANNFYMNSSSKTTVNGTRYFYGPVTIGAPTGGVVTPSAVVTLTGMNVLVGSVGGTDSWIVELHDSAGNLLATSNTSGVTAGTANTWQQIPFYNNTSAAAQAYLAAPGTYWFVLQSNGTTAHPAVFNAPVFPLFTGSATGTFGTGASITPATTYTAALGPVMFPYT